MLATFFRRRGGSRAGGAEYSVVTLAEIESSPPHAWMLACEGDFPANCGILASRNTIHCKASSYGPEREGAR